MTGGSSASRPGELPTLTPLRGIAAMLVVLYHVQILVRRHDVDLFAGAAAAFLEKGYLFVDLFFALSGFVIAHVYGRRSLLDRESYGRFLVLRLARIYPIHALIVGAAAIPHVIGAFTGRPDAFAEPTSGGALATELLLLDSVGIHDRLTWNEMSWSVSAEWISYLLAPALLVVLRWRRTDRLVAPAVLAACWAGLALLAGDGVLDNAYDLGAVRGVLGFTSGIALYRLHTSGDVDRLVSRSSVLLGALASIALLTTGGANDALVLPLFGLLILSGVSGEGVVQRVLNHRYLVKLGDISYSIYLLQYLFLLGALAAIESIGDERFAQLPTPVLRLSLCLFLAALVAVSHVTHSRIEVPARDHVRAKLELRRRAEDGRLARSADRLVSSAT